MSWKDTPVCGCHAPRDGQEFSGRTLYAPACRRAPPPASHTQCLPMSMPHHPCASRRAPPPASHTQCLLMAMPHHPCASRPPRAHAHTQCLPMSMPHHPCASRPPHTHSACPPRSPITPNCLSPCAPPMSSYPPQKHYLPTATPNNMYLSPAPPPEQTGARHGKQDASYTGTSGTTPHGKNKSIAYWHQK